MTPNDVDFWLLLGAMCAPWAVGTLYFIVSGIRNR